MSMRPFIKPNVVINAGDMSLTSLTSNLSIINMLPGISYDVSWTGSPTGTFAVQVSNSVVFNSDGSIKSAGNWNTLPSGAFMDTLPAPSGSAGHGFIDVTKVTQAYAIRLVYTKVSGTGSLTAYACSKVL